MNHPTWIRLPPARRGAKCPVSSWSRRKLQTLIYGVPSQGIPAKVKFKHVPGGRGDKGMIYIHVPSLMAHMLGEAELPQPQADVIRILAKSPEWCQTAINTLLDLCIDRAGLTAADFLTYLTATQSPTHGTGTNHHPEGPANHAGGNGQSLLLRPA